MEAPSSYSTKLVSFQNRIQNLLQKTPPDGEGYTRMISSILKRESHWVNWKNEKCKVYERPLPTSLQEVKKRKYETVATKMTISKIQKNTVLDAVLTPGLDASLELKSLASPKDIVTKTLADYIELFTEAWDPENGIDKEYWPHHDQVCVNYCTVNIEVC